MPDSAKMLGKASFAGWRKPLWQIRPALVAILLLLSCGAPVRAESEAAVKAAYIQNFAKLVDWPPGAFSTGQTLIIGVAGRESVGDEVVRALQGASANGRKIEVRRVSMSDAGTLRTCHLIFVPDSETGRSIIAATRGHPVLVIGDEDGFVERGGALGFVKEAGTVKFQANPKAAARNGLTLSAKLLRVAQSVNEG